MIVHGRPKDILTENIIEQVFNIKTTVIENPITGKPLVVYSWYIVPNCLAIIFLAEHFLNIIPAI